MSKNNFKEQLIATLENNYNIEQPYALNQHDFEFYGQYIQRNAKYFASKKMEYYSFSNYDHVFYKSIDSVTVDYLKNLVELTQEIIDTYSKVSEEHMETTITYMLYTETPLTSDAIQFIKSKMNYMKTYSFGLKGWSKLKILIMVPTSDEVYSNRFGKRDTGLLKKLLQKN